MLLKEIIMTNNIDVVVLEHFNGERWIFVSEWLIESMAWTSLGGDDFNYRTLDKDGNVLTCKN